ncbi:MAG: choline ABC transporter permease subunit, partial [Mesorhizobium sp.]|nr:choline ABC transporter permease subunit [Mesorhizobium sp.]
MDPISELVRSAKIPIGSWGKAFFDFLTTNFEWFFDSIADGVTFLLDGLIDLLLWFPPVVLVALIAALAWWLQKSWKLALAVAIGLLFIVNQGLWKETVETSVRVVGA